MPRPVYITDGARTPFLKARDKPGPFTPADLAVQCGRPLLLRQPFAASAFDEVILGCANQLADEMNVARVAALRLGCGANMPAWTVHRNCGSGMQSIDVAFRGIADGRLDLVLAGGTEALSRAPLIVREAAVEYDRLVETAEEKIHLQSELKSLQHRVAVLEDEVKRLQAT